MQGTLAHRTNDRSPLTGYKSAAYSRGMSQLLLIRHGQASFGAADYDRLSETGERQSRLVGRHLAALGWRPDVLVTGTLRRQRDTASALAQALDETPAPVAEPGFDEYDADGIVAAYLPRVLAEDQALAAQRDALKTDRRLFQKAFEQVTRHWVLGSEPEQPLESWAAFNARVGEVLRRLHDDYPRDARIAVCSSGGPIAVAVATALEASALKTIELNWGIRNASVSELRSTRQGWRLTAFNDVAALRAAGDADLLTFR